MQESDSKKQRKEFRNIGPADLLFHIKQPPAAKASFLHRVSGALLVILLPIVIVPLFAASVSSPTTFNTMKAWVDNPVGKIVLLVMIWAYCHHFLAGIRFLILDTHTGDSKKTSQRTGAVVIGLALLLAVIFGTKLFGLW